MKMRGGMITDVSDREETPEEWKARIGIGQRSHAFRSMDSGPGTARPVKVMREDKPGVAGIQTDHWDGRKDATVFPDQARVQGKARPQGS